MPVVPNPGRQRQRQVVNPGYPVGLYLKSEQAKQTNKKIKENKKKHKPVSEEMAECWSFKNEALS